MITMKELKNGLLIKALAVVMPCVAAGLMLYATRAHGDVPTLPEPKKCEVPLIVNGVQHSVSAYASGDILAVWPVPVFKADPKTGHVAVDHEPPLKPGGLAKVSVQLVMNPSPLLKAAQAEIAAREGKAVPKLSSVVLRELSVEEQPGKQSRLFEPLNQPGESSGSGEYTLIAYMPEAEAKVYAEELRTGKRHAEFRVTAKLYAVRETGKATATARVAKIKDTNAYTKLVGTGGTSSTTAKDNIVSQTAAPMTRSQQQELTAKIADEIALALQITGNPKQLGILKEQVAEFMKLHAFGKERQIDITVAELTKLNPYEFDPADLKPDVVEKFVADVKAFLNKESRDTASFAAGGSGWGVSANASYSKEQLRKKLEDKGWNISQEGKKFIPKSITVHDVNRQVIDTHVGFSGMLTENSYSEILFNQQVTTRARIAVDMSPDDVNRLAVLEQKLNEEAGRWKEAAKVVKQLEKLIESQKVVTGHWKFATKDKNTGTDGSNMDTHWVRVEFPTRFSAPPKVFTSLSAITPENYSFHVLIEKVTEDGFDLKLNRPQGFTDKHHWESVVVHYLAVPDNEKVDKNLGNEKVDKNPGKVIGKKR